MKNKTFISLFIQLLLVYVCANILFLMIFGSRHPLIGLIQEWPLYGQILIAIPISIGFYIIPGYLFVVAKKHELDVSKYFIHVILSLITINLVIFILAHIISTMSYNKGVWVLYSFMNPSFGSLIYDVSEYNVSWFWIVSALFAPIGLGTGIYLRLRRLRSIYK